MGPKNSPKVSSHPANSETPAPAPDPAGTVRIDKMSVQLLREELGRKGLLLIIDGAAADLGKYYSVETSIVIGRDANGFQLADEKCSRCHAKIEKEGTQYVLRDLKSTNGTMVNSSFIHHEHVLCDGDRIWIGKTILKFTLVDSTEASYLRKVEEIVSRDDLTGLLSKRRFDMLLSEATRKARTTQTALSVLMMDMDGLKAINDRHGHQAGAATISQVGKILQEQLHECGEACRFGGDEFCAFLPGANLEKAFEISENIRRTIAETAFAFNDLKLRASISIGVTTLAPPPPYTSDELIRRADLALYRAKAKGRNAVSD